MKRLLFFTPFFFLVGFFGPVSVFAETTQNQSLPLDIDYGPQSNCGRLDVVADLAQVYRKRPLDHRDTLGYEYTNKVYDKGQPLNIHSISGDYAKVIFFPEGHGYIPKSAFNAENFERLRTSCAHPGYDNPNDRLGGPDDLWSEGMAPHKDIENNQIASVNLGPIDRNHLDRAFCNLQQFYNEKGRREGYAFINIPNGFKFRTFVVDLSNNQVVDQFDSLKSYKGIGCGENMTRPGIFRLSNQYSPGAMGHSWWGPGAPAYVMTNVGGHEKKYGGGGDNYWCKSNPTVKAHMNTNMKGASSGGTRYSAGCFITSQDKFEKWTRGENGNALIVNFDPKRDNHPNCPPRK